MKTLLLIVDPQFDFCSPEGALFVPGADESMERLAKLINDNAANINYLFCSQEDHPEHHISFRNNWTDVLGESPRSGTKITEEHVRNNYWFSKDEAVREIFKEYVRRNGYLTVYEPHCCDYKGRELEERVGDAIYRWSRWDEEDAVRPTPIYKGIFPYKEEYSALEEINDISRNTFFYRAAQVDRVLVAGEVLNICVIETLKSIAYRCDPELLEKTILLMDCTDKVPCDEWEFKRDIENLVSRGLKLCKSTELKW